MNVRAVLWPSQTSSPRLCIALVPFTGSPQYTDALQALHKILPISQHTLPKVVSSGQVRRQQTCQIFLLIRLNWDT